MPSWSVFLPTCSGVFSQWWTRQHTSSTACVTQTTSPTHSSASIGSGLRRECGSRRPCSCTRPLMELRRHTRVNWFVSPICLVDVPSTLLGPIVCWYCPLNCLPSAEEPSQSPDSPFATFYRTVWSLLRLCRPSVSVWKHICSRPRSLTLSSTPLNYSPTFRGRWSGFITWTTHDWLNCNGVCRLVTLPRNCVYALFWGCAVVSTCVTSSLRRQRRARSNIISAP